ANWTLNELLARLDAETSLSEVAVRPAHLARLVVLIEEGAISGKIAKKVFDEIFETGENPDAIIEKKGLKQISDPRELGEIVDTIVAQNPEQVESFRDGNTNLLGWFVGQVMKATRGQANPKLANQIL